jgi:two-component system, sensor histidine kinase PdtaS
LVDGTLRASANNVAVLLVIDDRAPCTAVRQGSMTPDELTRLDATMLARPSLRSWASPIPGDFRYDIVSVHDGYATVAHITNVGGNPGRRAMVLSDGDILDMVFELGPSSPDNVVGLMRPQGEVFTQRGGRRSEPSWLPVDWPAGRGPATWISQQRNGGEGSFSRYLAIEPDIYVVTRMSLDSRRQAKLSLAVLAGAPLLLLALLLVTFWRFVRRSVVAPFDRIESAARAEAAGDLMARVDLSGDMPSDVQRVAEAFNRMADAARAREVDLRSSLAANQGLMRELHHRVKNSLQVIQSHLAITRRKGEQPTLYLLNEAEARVQVLSIAYRYGLTERGLQQVPLKQYLGELIGYLAESAARHDQRVVGSFDVAAALDIDRAIPLGLSIVEVVFTCLRARKCRTVQVLAHDQTRSTTELVISMDGDARSMVLSERILRGLRQQLGALDDTPRPGEQLRWAIGLPDRAQDDVSNDIADGTRPS